MKDSRMGAMFCRCGCGRLRLHQHLWLILIRLRCLVEYEITSLYRCEEWNDEVGGHPDSRHKKGEAVDLKIPGISMLDALAILEDLPIGGIGVYDEGFFHIQLGARRYWARKNGKYQSGKKAAKVLAAQIG